MKRALIAMSGGVDSSVSAYLMKERGYECIGCTMKLYQNEDAGIPREHGCCTAADVEDARAVAYSMGMRYYVFNFTYDFREKVIGKFVRSYENGTTPNPCIDCNRYMKFSKLFDRARVLECDFIVTGHYARIEKTGDKYILKKAIDETKDQSYVLYSMTQCQLAHTLFPLGNLKKSEVRQIAAENGFVNAKKPDSQDICFVPDGDYAKVIELYTGKASRPGNFIDTQGNVVGRHKGIIHYTLGQRKGLGVSLSRPCYVCRINPADNTVTLGDGSNLYHSRLNAIHFNWISGKPQENTVRCKAKIRYRQMEQPATATVNGDNSVTVVFDEPQRAVTPGQAIVLYDGDICLGGGEILDFS